MKHVRDGIDSWGVLALQYAYVGVYLVVYQKNRPAFSCDRYGSVLS